MNTLISFGFVVLGFIVGSLVIQLFKHLSTEEIILVGVWFNGLLQSAWFMFDVYLVRRKK